MSPIFVLFAVLGYLTPIVWLVGLTVFAVIVLAIVLVGGSNTSGDAWLATFAVFLLGIACVVSSWVGQLFHFLVHLQQG